MTRPPDFFHPIDTDGRAVDSVACPNCHTALQFDIQHFTGQTIVQCRCTPWRVVPRRAAPPLPIAAEKVRRQLTRAETDEKRAIVRAELPADPRAAVSLSELCERVPAPSSLVRKEVIRMIRDGVAAHLRGQRTTKTGARHPVTKYFRKVA